MGSLEINVANVSVALARRRCAMGGSEAKLYYLPMESW